MRDEDDSWFEALAGHSADSDAAASAKEGASLRQAVLARRTSEPGTLLAIDPARETELLSRARVAGLLEPGALVEIEGVAMLPSP